MARAWHEGARVYVDGADTLLGAAIARRLRAQDVALVAPKPAEPLAAFFEREAPTHVFAAGGASGGILQNQRFPADLMRDNLLVVTELLELAHRHGVRKLLYLGSSCGYPRLAPQPMREEALFTGPLEPTSAPYAMAKLAGLTLCQAYRRQHGSPFVVAIPANAFGPQDDFDTASGHVVPALLRRVHEAKLAGAPAVEVWGTGAARREFVAADDVAEACQVVMAAYDDEAPINLGGAGDVSIRELAEAICRVVGYAGELRFDTTKPDGMPFKALEGSRLAALGWQPRRSLDQALAETYTWFLDHAQEVAHVG